MVRFGQCLDNVAKLTINKSYEPSCLTMAMNSWFPRGKFNVKSYLVLEVQPHLRNIQQEDGSEGFRDF